MTLLSGTLADIDLATIAAATSLGRASLRFELSTATGERIGRLVLKAGRIVSATAGARHGQEALSVIMSAGRDARFELAHEPIEPASIRAIGSVDQLASLGRGAHVTRTAAPPDPPAMNGRASAVNGNAPSTARGTSRVQMMQGRLDEFDLMTLLQTIGMGRQLVELEIRDRAGAALGAVRVKSGKVVAAHARGSVGLEAISELMSSPASFQFASFRVGDDLGQATALASLSDVMLRFADLSVELRDRVIVEGSLSEFDIPTLLQTLGTGRQHCALEVHDELTCLGVIFMKSGMVLAARAGDLVDTQAIRHLVSLGHDEQFRVVRLASPTPAQTTLGSIQQVLLDLAVPEARVPAVASTSAAPDDPGPSQAKRKGGERIARWAIPVAVVLGGAIVLLIVRGTHGTQSANSNAAQVVIAKAAMDAARATQGAASATPAATGAQA
ncbi:MAG: DUF4388 domain-containing protein, partial [Myxococcales bacterium]|nr:DUF4388 domain-containing protein [Myxococcales bacterium]